MENNLEPNKRRQVRMAIGHSMLGYENLIHINFVMWCEAMSTKFYYSARDLIINESLFKYYQNQWAILVENRLLLEYGYYIKKELPDTHHFYYEIIEEYASNLENYYPASLLPKKEISINTKYQFNYN